MAVPSQVVRLFISSTFADFRNERDVLQRQVFPYLSELCRANGLEFQAVDLRWGIREEEAFEQKTLEICLREVQRCIDISPMPNFLILLGERYGWQPLPTHIPREDFIEICQWLGQHEVGTRGIPTDEVIRLLNHWYKLDSNALPESFRLQSRSGQYLKFKYWSRTERELQEILRAAVSSLDWSSPRSDRYLLSATAQEIMHGLLDANDGGNSQAQRVDVKNHVFCFHRKRFGVLPNIESPVSSVFSDTTTSGEKDVDALSRLNDLSTVLKEKLGNNYLVYQAFSTDSTNATEAGISTHHLDAFANDSRHLLETVIRGEIEKFAAVNAIQREIAKHENFFHEKLVQFVGRSSQLDSLSEKQFHCGTTLVFHGVGGVGKSSLMAKAIDHAMHDGFKVFYRFIGLTSESSSGLELLRNLCNEFADFLKKEIRQREDVAGWGDEFKRLILQLGKTSSKYTVVIDAVDQLSPDDPAREFFWMPKELPRNVRFIVSTLDGSTLDVMRSRLLNTRYVAVDGLGMSDAEILLTSWLATYKRQLQPKQKNFVLERFSSNGLPLYLRLAVEEVRRWTSYPDANDVPNQLSQTVEGLINQIFDRLELPQNHGQLMVRRTFGYLVAARFGLTESELMDVLSADERLMEQFRKESPQGKELSRLPFIVWSRLRDEIEPYLSERQANGLPAIAFFHRIFREVAEARYLGSTQDRKSLHGALAKYFNNQSTRYVTSDGDKPNRRRLSELAFHYLHSAQLQNMCQLITDPGYFDAKLEIGDHYELFTEYLQCRQALAKRSRSDEQLLQLSVALARHVIRNINKIDIEDLHAFLAFRKDTQLYKDLLKSGTQLLKANRHRTSTNALQRLYLGMRARQGNLLRRAGQLKVASRLLLTIEQELSKFGQSAELSRVEYDLGYIDYLDGNLDEAAHRVMKSAQTARRSGNEVGYCISACVAANIDWLIGMRQGDGAAATRRMHKVLNASIKVFESRKFEDTTSERWVMNVYAHRFNLAYRAGDLAQACKLASLLETDPWLKGFGDDVSVERCSARLNLLEGQYLEGAKRLEALALKRLKKSNAEEALAEDFMDAGFGYRLAGNEPMAQKMWDMAKQLPKSYGNHYWQTVISAT